MPIDSLIQAPLPTTKPESHAKILAELDRLRSVVTRPPTGHIRYPYCIPGGFYQNQWDWDGFFIACHLAARTPSAPDYLRFWALNVIDSQLPDGDWAACLSPQGPRTAHPSLRLKPFLAQGIELYLHLKSEIDWLIPHYPTIRQIVTRRESSHLHSPTNLFAWEDAMQSGADDNVALSNDPTQARSIAACDLNAFQVLEYRALSRIASALGHHADQALFEQRANHLAQSILHFLWSEQDESLWNLHLIDGTWLRRISYSNFVPLAFGLIPQSQGQAMIQRYLLDQDHLLSPFGFRSLSRKDPDYTNVNIIVPYSNWRGPVWPIANFFYFLALRRYHFTRHCEELTHRLSQLYLDDIAHCGSLHENYHAETGKPLAPSAEQSPHGIEGGFVGWNLLLVDMIDMLDQPHPIWDR